MDCDRLTLAARDTGFAAAWNNRRKKGEYLWAVSYALYWRVEIYFQIQINRKKLKLIYLMISYD